MYFIVFRVIFNYERFMEALQIRLYVAVIQNFKTL